MRSESRDTPTDSAASSGRVEALLRELEKRDAAIAELQNENARLWRSYEMLKEELALVKRRLFVAKAERVDTKQLQMEFDELVKKLNRLAGELPPKPSGEAAAGGRVRVAHGAVANFVRQRPRPR